DQEEQENITASIKITNALIDDNNKALELYVINPENKAISINIKVGKIVKEIDVNNEGSYKIDMSDIPPGTHKAILTCVYEGNSIEQEFMLEVKGREDSNVPKRKRTLRIDDL
ncbi:MAG: hypothetical protein QXS98_07630, partial [Candidatus Nitrosocaldus sp.]